MNSDAQPILRIFDAYQAAVLAKDTAPFAALYASDVRVFDLWARWSQEGAAACLATATDWFGSLGSDRVVVTVEDVQTIITPEIAVAHAFLTYKGISAEGVELRAMSNRLTWVLRQVGGEWKIAHEHTSAPVDPETMKVILKR